MHLLDLFCGLGGFSLAAHTLGIDTVMFCDSKQHSPYVWQVIPRHFPDVPLHDDVTTLTKEEVEDALADAERNRRGPWGAERKGLRGRAASDSSSRPLILTAGFPCQDLSYAGKGAGLEGERSGLYSEVIRLVRSLRPEWVLLENVNAILTRGVGTVLADLAASGYGWAYGCVPACAVGAPHRRDRWWCVAWPSLGDEADRARGERLWTAVMQGLTPFGDERWTTPIANEAEKRGDHREGLRGQVVAHE